ncbi:hypothetical protein [Azospirillum soli]|uniref:hypothetical protein n=1 Tax=Azospirillum soli TaxID=1304799 RepID=UPI001AE939CF|nr:hypothetical protein [Azospirillum soli]MBP2313774.1 hypothetical protein [Azospirillum soli]
MPQTFVRVLAVTLALTALSGCARYSLVQPAKRTVQNAMVVEPGIEWNRIDQLGWEDTGRLDVWTVDGEGLHNLLLLSGVEDGKPLFNAAPGTKETPPAFRKGMTTDELVSLFEAAYTKVNTATVYTTRAVKPVTVSGGDGVRIEFSFVGKDEVDREGVAVATQKDGKLYMVVHQAPKLHYQQKFMPEVERILASMQVVGK